MSELVADCPRCDAIKITFDLKAAVLVGVEYRWKHYYEAFCVCRHCGKSTTFLVSEKNVDAHEKISRQSLARVNGSANDYVKVERYLSARDRASTPPPDHLPQEISAAFQEAATCLSANCFNAAGTMFRLCIDLATKSLIPQEDGPGLNAKVRRDLGLRLPWMFENGVLPSAIRDLSHCIKEDGNDGAHAGSLTAADAEDLLDFTMVLLERLFTEPRRLELAKSRRETRRARLT